MRFPCFYQCKHTSSLAMIVRHSLIRCRSVLSWPSGKRPGGWRQTQYDYPYVFGAVCTQTGQTIGLLSPYINTDAVNVFFKEFEKECNPDVHVVMIWDQAGFYTSDKVKLPKNVTLVSFPPLYNYQ